MRLTWSNSAEIAAALLDAYPDADRLAISHSDLLKMIRMLPDFLDSPEPPRLDNLDHILWTWMRLADEQAPRQERA